MAAPGGEAVSRPVYSVQFFLGRVNAGLTEFVVPAPGGEFVAVVRQLVFHYDDNDIGNFATFAKGGTDIFQAPQAALAPENPPHYAVECRIVFEEGESFGLTSNSGNFSYYVGGYLLSAV